MSEFGKVVRYKVNIQKSILTPTMSYQKEKPRKNPIYYLKK